MYCSTIVNHCLSRSSVMIFMKLYLAQSVSEEPGILEDKLKAILIDNVGTGTIFDVNNDNEKKGTWFRYQKDGEDLLFHFAKFDSSSFAYIQGDDIDEDDTFDDRYPVSQNIFSLVYKDYVVYSSMNNLSKNIISKYFLKQYQIPFNICFVSDRVLINRIRDIGIKNLSFGDKLSSDEFVNSSQNDPKALAMMDNFAGDELVSLKRTLVLTVKPKRFRGGNLELTSEISEREKEITDKICDGLSDNLDEFTFVLKDGTPVKNSQTKIMKSIHREFTRSLIDLRRIIFDELIRFRNELIENGTIE